MQYNPRSVIFTCKGSAPINGVSCFSVMEQIEYGIVDETGSYPESFTWEINLMDVKFIGNKTKKVYWSSKKENIVYEQSVSHGPWFLAIKA